VAVDEDGGDGNTATVLCNTNIYSSYYVVLCLYVQWVYPGRQRDRGGQHISDVIDIDAEHTQFEFDDGSGDQADDDDDDDIQSGEGESSGGRVIYIAINDC